MAKETISIINNSTGESAEYPLLKGSAGIPVADIRKISQDLGIFTYDLGYVSTASCKSAITFIDGEKGILLYRGYPIEELAANCTFIETAYLLMRGHLPSESQLAGFNDEVNYRSAIHEGLIRLFHGFNHDSHPMAMMVGVVGSLSAFYHSELDIHNLQHREICATRLIGKLPMIASLCYRHSVGRPVVYPRADLEYCENFMNMMFSRPEEQSFITKGHYLDPVAIKALNMLFILHADHEQNASTSTVRLAGSTGANPYACMAAGIAALWGPAHGGANEAVLSMLQEIGTVDNIEKYVNKAKDKNDPFRLMGFGHRVYKNFDPRALIIRDVCHEVLAHKEELGPLFELALALEQYALNDEYFIERKLYPNVDFYSGLIYKALNIPVDMFTVMFTIARTAGWAAHWLEMMASPVRPIGRPRQLYEGSEKRDFVPIARRGL